MAGTLEIFGMLALIVIIILLVYNLVIVVLFRKYLKEYSEARGANGIGSGTQVTMTCPSGKVIQIETAHLVKSSQDMNNFEDGSCDPFDRIGEFNPATTADISKTLGSSANGKNSFTYTLAPPSSPSCVSKATKDLQLIASYICKPE